MLAAILLAALPLGVWPVDSGPAAAVVDEVEFYLDEPEDDYFVIATQQLAPPLGAMLAPAALKPLAALAHRLGADGVLLLAELAEKDIPADPDEPLPPGKRLVTAVFVAFASDTGDDRGPTFAGRTAHRGSGVSPLHHRRAPPQRPAHVRAVFSRPPARRAG